MAPQVSSTITDSLARGMRKDADRLFARVHEHDWLLSQRPRSMRGTLRLMEKLLIKVYGGGRAKCVQSEKKRACWMFIQPRGTGLGYEVGLSLFGRTATKTINEETYFPVAVSEHFVERFIQTQRSPDDSLVSLIENVIEALVPFYGPTRTSKDSSFASWTQSGSCWIAAEQGLIIGEVPPKGEAVLKTIIGADALEAPKRKAWEQIRRSESKVSFRPRNTA